MKFRVSWTTTSTYATTVEANSEEEAYEMAERGGLVGKFTGQEEFDCETIEVQKESEE